MRTRLLIVSDQRLLRDALVASFQPSADLSVAGVARSRVEAVALAHRLAPAAAVLDRTMPESLLAAREMLGWLPALRIMAIGVQETEPAVAACADAGIAGLAPRDDGGEALVDGVRRMLRGELICSATVARLLAQRRIAPNGHPDGVGPLTWRETQIARLLEQGQSNKEIARDLGIEVATVKNHVHRLLRKLDASRRSQVGPRWRRLASIGGLPWAIRTAG